MQLQKKQVQHLIEKRPKRQLLQKAERHQNRLKLHGETEIESIRTNPAYVELLNWVESLLTRDKYKRFCDLLRLPVVSLEITQDIYQEYFRIFEGQNPFFNYEFSNPDFADTFKAYLKNGLKEWEGNNQNVYNSQNKNFDEFVYSSEILRKAKELLKK